MSAPCANLPSTNKASTWASRSSSFTGCSTECPIIAVLQTLLGLPPVWRPQSRHPMPQELKLALEDQRILVLAPTGRDATLSVAFLEKAHLHSYPCKSMEELLELSRDGCAALLMAEEALDAASIESLNRVLDQQPSWSDLPITLITSHRTETERLPRYRKIFTAGANITLLERPFHPATLVSTLEVAIRARRRQYQIRDLLNERGQHLKELERRVAERT